MAQRNNPFFGKPKKNVVHNAFPGSRQSNDSVQNQTNNRSNFETQQTQNNQSLGNNCQSSNVSGHNKSIANLPQLNQNGPQPNLEGKTRPHIRPVFPISNTLVFPQDATKNRVVPVTAQSQIQGQPGQTVPQKTIKHTIKLTLKTPLKSTRIQSFKELSQGQLKSIIPVNEREKASLKQELIRKLVSSQLTGAIKQKYDILVPNQQLRRNVNNRFLTSIQNRLKQGFDFYNGFSALTEKQKKAFKFSMIYGKSHQKAISFIMNIYKATSRQGHRMNVVCAFYVFSLTSIKKKNLQKHYFYNGGQVNESQSLCQQYKIHYYYFLLCDKLQLLRVLRNRIQMQGRHCSLFEEKGALGYFRTIFQINQYGSYDLQPNQGTQHRSVQIFNQTIQQVVSIILLYNSKNPQFFQQTTMFSESLTFLQQIQHKFSRYPQLLANIKALRNQVLQVKIPMILIGFSSKKKSQSKSKSISSSSQNQQIQTLDVRMYGSWSVLLRYIFQQKLQIDDRQKQIDMLNILDNLQMVKEISSGEVWLQEGIRDKIQEYCQRIQKIHVNQANQRLQLLQLFVFVKLLQKLRLSSEQKLRQKMPQTDCQDFVYRTLKQIKQLFRTLIERLITYRQDISTLLLPLVTYYTYIPSFIDSKALNNITLSLPSQYIYSILNGIVMKCNLQLNFNQIQTKVLKKLNIHQIPQDEVYVKCLKQYVKKVNQDQSDHLQLENSCLIAVNLVFDKIWNQQNQMKGSQEERFFKVANSMKQLGQDKYQQVRSITQSLKAYGRKRQMTHKIQEPQQSQNSPLKSQTNLDQFSLKKLQTLKLFNTKFIAKLFEMSSLNQKTAQNSLLVKKLLKTLYHIFSYLYYTQKRKDLSYGFLLCKDAIQKRQWEGRVVQYEVAIVEEVLRHYIQRDILLNDKMQTKAQAGQQKNKLVRIHEHLIFLDLFLVQQQRKNHNQTVQGGNPQQMIYSLSRNYESLSNERNNQNSKNLASPFQILPMQHMVKLQLAKNYLSLVYQHQIKHLQINLLNNKKLLKQTKTQSQSPLIIQSGSSQTNQEVLSTLQLLFKSFIIPKLGVCMNDQYDNKQTKNTNVTHAYAGYSQGRNQGNFNRVNNLQPNTMFTFQQPGNIYSQFALAKRKDLTQQLLELINVLIIEKCNLRKQIQQIMQGYIKRQKVPSIGVVTAQIQLQKRLKYDQGFLKQIFHSMHYIIQYVRIYVGGKQNQSKKIARQQFPYQIFNCIQQTLLLQTILYNEQQFIEEGMVSEIRQIICLNGSSNESMICRDICNSLFNSCPKLLSYYSHSLVNRLLLSYSSTEQGSQTPIKSINYSSLLKSISQQNMLFLASNFTDSSVKEQDLQLISYNLNRYSVNTLHSGVSQFVYGLNVKLSGQQEKKLELCLIQEKNKFTSQYLRQTGEYWSNSTQDINDQQSIKKLINSAIKGPSSQQIKASLLTFTRVAFALKTLQQYFLSYCVCPSLQGSQRYLRIKQLNFNYLVKLNIFNLVSMFIKQLNCKLTSIKQRLRKNQLTQIALEYPKQKIRINLNIISNKAPSNNLLLHAQQGSDQQNQNSSALLLQLSALSSLSMKLSPVLLNFLFMKQFINHQIQQNQLKPNYSSSSKIKIQIKKVLDEEGPKMKQNWIKLIEVVLMINIEWHTDDSFRHYFNLIVNVLPIIGKYAREVNFISQTKVFKVLLQTYNLQKDINQNLMQSRLLSQILPKLTLHLINNAQSLHTNILFIPTDQKQDYLLNYVLIFSTLYKNYIKQQFKIETAEQPNRRQSQKSKQSMLFPFMSEAIRLFLAITQILFEQQMNRNINSQSDKSQKMIQDVLLNAAKIIQVIYLELIQIIQVRQYKQDAFKDQIINYSALRQQIESLKRLLFNLVIQNQYKDKQKTQLSPTQHQSKCYKPGSKNLKQINNIHRYLCETVAQGNDKLYKKYKLSPLQTKNTHQQTAPTLKELLSSISISNQQLQSLNQQMVYLGFSQLTPKIKCISRGQFQHKFSNYMKVLSYLPEIKVQLIQNGQTHLSGNCKDSHKANYVEGEHSKYVQIPNYNQVVRFLESFVSFLKSNKGYQIYYSDIFGSNLKTGYQQIWAQFSTIWKSINLIKDFKQDYPQQSYRLSEPSNNVSQFPVFQFVLCANLKIITLVTRLFTAMFSRINLLSQWNLPPQSQSKFIDRYNNSKYFCHTLIMHLITSQSSDYFNYILEKELSEGEAQESQSKLQSRQFKTFNKLNIIRPFQAKLVLGNLCALMCIIFSKQLLEDSQAKMPLGKLDYANNIFLTNNSRYYQVSLLDLLARRLIWPTICVIKIGQGKQMFSKIHLQQNLDFFLIQSKVDKITLKFQKYKRNSASKNKNKQQTTSFFNFFEDLSTMDLLNNFVRFINLMDKSIHLQKQFKDNIFRDKVILYESFRLTKTFYDNHFNEQKMMIKRQQIQIQEKITKKQQDDRKQLLQLLHSFKYSFNPELQVQLHSFLLNDSVKSPGNQFIKQICSSLVKEIQMIRQHKFTQNREEQRAFFDMLAFFTYDEQKPGCSSMAPSQRMLNDTRILFN